MQQHELALTLYAHKLHEPELALGYCDRIYLAATSTLNGMMTSSSGTTQLRQPDRRAALEIYHTLLKVYLNPQKSTKEVDRTVATLTASRGTVTNTVGFAHKVKGQVAKKIAEIEGLEGPTQSLSSADSAPETGPSDGEESTEGGKSIEGMMLDEALNLLSRRWDRIDGVKALHLLPSETKLQQLLPFLEPLLKKSSGTQRNLSVIKSLRHSENLQLKDELYESRKRVVKVSNESICCVCNTRIGSSAFAVYPNDTSMVHLACFRDSQTIKALAAAP